MHVTSSAPRVVHLVPAPFDPNVGIVGGAERYAFELARHMSNHVPTTLLTFGERTMRHEVGALDVQVIGPYHKVRGARTNPVSRALFGHLRRADIIHCHQQHVVASSVAAIFARACGKRVFVTDLGGGGWDLSSYVSTDALYHGHLHISQYSRSVFHHESRANATVILGGVDTSRFVPDPATARRHVLFVGRLLPHKGVDTLIRALPAGCTLQVVGRPYHAEYYAELRRLADGKDVEFVLDADDAQLLLAYQRASCIVLPSVHTDMYGQQTMVPELLGQTLLEGMACGAPAICSNVASLPEIVTEGVDGFIIPPNDPCAMADRLHWIMANAGTAQAMGARARESVTKRFSWEAVVRRCLGAYGLSADAS